MDKAARQLAGVKGAGLPSVPMDDPNAPVDRWKPQPAEDHRDQLPAELDASGLVGPYLFPDNARRRISAAIYAVIGVALVLLWITRRTGGVLVNRGLLVGGVVMVVVALYHLRAGYPLAVRDL